MATTTLEGLPNKEERAKIGKRRERFTSLCVLKLFTFQKCEIVR